MTTAASPSRGTAAWAGRPGNLKSPRGAASRPAPRSGPDSRVAAAGENSGRRSPDAGDRRHQHHHHREDENDGEHGGELRRTRDLRPSERARPRRWAACPLLRCAGAASPSSSGRLCQEAPARSAGRRAGAGSAGRPSRPSPVELVEFLRRHEDRAGLGSLRWSHYTTAPKEIHQSAGNARTSRSLRWQHGVTLVARRTTISIAWRATRHRLPADAAAGPTVRRPRPRHIPGPPGGANG